MTQPLCGQPGSPRNSFCESGLALAATAVTQLARRMKLPKIATPLLLLVAGVVAYHNSLRIPFLLDDLWLVRDNPNIRSFATAFTDSSRPVVQLSLAVNYALGGGDVTGYHVVNLALHLAAGCVLFGLIRQTGRARGTPTDDLAFAVALLWVVHPLASQAVNYIIQRGELLMSLCYLLTLYGVVRAFAEPGNRRWAVLAVASCTLGMACKSVMVTAPIVAWLYAAILLRQRWHPLYFGLAATWLVLPVVLAHSTGEWKGSAGLAVTSLTPVTYALAQAKVVAHYLRLAVWPVGLCFDYAWPAVAHWPSIIFMAALLAVTIWAVARRTVAGCLAACFFLLLAPTSSFLPIQDVAVEHRMYLALAPVIALVVLGLPTRWRMYLVAGLAVTLTILTIRRNADYRSNESLWRATVAVSPRNVRAWTNLGNAIGEDPNRFDEAVSAYREALRVDPGYALAHYNWAHLLVGRGRLSEAEEHYRSAIAAKADDILSHYNLGMICARQGRYLEAIAQFEAVLKVHPGNTQSHYNIGVAREKLGEVDAAITAYETALRWDPAFAKGHYFLAQLLARTGRAAEAQPHFETAGRLDPAFAGR